MQKVKSWGGPANVRNIQLYHIILLLLEESAAEAAAFKLQEPGGPALGQLRCSHLLWLCLSADQDRNTYPAHKQKETTAHQNCR